MSDADDDDVARSAFSDFGDEEEDWRLWPAWDVEDDPEGFDWDYPAASDQQGSVCSAFAHQGHDQSPTKTSSRAPAETGVVHPFASSAQHHPDKRQIDLAMDRGRCWVTFAKNIKASRSFTQTWTDLGSTCCR
jgi:hypothetical protein